MSSARDAEIMDNVAIWLRNVKRVFYLENGEEGELSPRTGHRFYSFDAIMAQQYCGNKKFGLPAECMIQELEQARRHSELVRTYMSHRLTALLKRLSKSDVFFGKYDAPYKTPNMKRVDYGKYTEVWGRYEKDPHPENEGSFENQRRHFLNRYSEEGRQQDASGRRRLAEFNSSVNKRLVDEVKRLKGNGNK